MKIQCACGAKYAFDVTPEMARAPITFVCQKCGADSSEMVNRLVRQQLGLPEERAGVKGENTASLSAPRTAPPATADIVVARVNAPAGAIPPAMASDQATTSGGATPLRVAVQNTAAASEAAAPTVDAPQVCLKHPDQLTVERCLVCQKPMCPKCMELFGYVCSALCRGKAEAQGITLPVYENQKTAVDARQWQKATRIAGSIVGVAVAVLGLWAWYAWYASVPRTAFSVRFPEAGRSGQCRLLPNNQVVFLHGGTLARHDMKAKKEIWSMVLIDKKKIAEEAAQSLDEVNRAWTKARAEGVDMAGWPIPPSLPEMIRNMEQAAAGALQLHLRGENVWVSFSDKLVHYDWQTGKPSQEVPLANPFAHFIPNGDELLLMAQTETGQKVTHINFASGESRTEEIAAPISSVTNQLANASKRNVPPGKGGSNQVAFATRSNRKQPGVPRAAAKPGQAKPKILDPAAVAAQAQNLPLPNKLALPAVLAANANQERLEEEMRDEPEMGVVLPVQEGLERTTLLPDGDRFVQFSVKLLESKTIERQAMKAPPTKSALEGDVNASSTAAVANEILNEIQRDRGGDVISEDVSRYQITLRCPGVPDAAEWVGEVIGPSEVFPLKTVNVLAAGKSVWVFDKANKKLWESKLNFPISGGGGGLVSGETRLFGDGPVVERGDTLYLFDQGVLSAFDMANGNARWRLPAVGVSGLHFDDEGMIYVNTSSASPDILRYPNQIDISEKATQIILKINAKTGATVWKLNQEGLVSYVSGKYIYSTVTHAGDGAGEGILGVKTGLELPPHIRIKRLDPGSGRVLWDYYQERFPLDFHFEKNTIQLLFKKEMLVLQYFSL